MGENRAHRWLELLKDYDVTILYHPGKANVVADTLSRKARSMGSLAFISAEERLLALDMPSLANTLVRLDISKPSQVLACFVAPSSLFERIKARQYDDLHLLALREMADQVDKLYFGYDYVFLRERLVQIYIQEIVRLHGVSVSIIADRGPQFTLHF
ncbi:uncharacterized protein [Nicotiana sylvestris]|uniref:uncharacterized protein n=1 Tax=Nicotiana sylvestris TaxID=4096 RepID=UPI00388CC06F